MHFNFMKNQISFPVKYLLHEIKIFDKGEETNSSLLQTFVLNNL